MQWHEWKDRDGGADVEASNIRKTSQTLSLSREQNIQHRQLQRENLF